MKKQAKRAVRIVAGALLISAVPRLTTAQEPKRWQVSAGYSFMHDAADTLDFPAGWSVGVAGRLNRWLSFAGDVDSHYKTVPSIGSDVRLASHAFTFGGRASAKLGAFTEFGQVLVGVLHTTGTLFGFTDTETRVALQPGIGLDYPFKARWAVRGELDARFINTGQELRVVTGLVYAFR
jgi:hypothetical protein